MLEVENFKKVIKCNVGDTQEGALHIWRNRDADTTALMQAAEGGRWSELADAEGFFAGVYEKAGKVYLFCDRLGIYPLYYSADKDGIYVSPSLFELLDTAQIEKTPCEKGIVSFLLFGHHLADETVFEGVKRCVGGQTIVIDDKGRINERILWKKKHIYQSEPSVSADELGEIFVQGVGKMLPADEKILIALSGGFDSRAVLGAVLECIEARRITTVTFGGEDTFDFQIGRLVARKAGVENIPFAITEGIYEDNFLRRRAGDYGYSYSAFASQPQEMLDCLVQKMSEGNVSLWGVGGDAITGSHLHSPDIRLGICGSFEDMSRLLLEKRALVPLSVASELIGLGENEIIEIAAGLIENSCLGEYDRAWQFLDAWDIFVRGRMELISVLPLNQESWCCPHFGREYFNLMSTQCFDEKIHQGIYRRMLASRFKFLYNLPTKRLKGRSLVSSQGRDLYWVLRSKADMINRLVYKLFGCNIVGVSRNYGNDGVYFHSVEGRKRFEHSIDILLQKDILRKNLNSVFVKKQKKVRIVRLLMTLRYAFDK